MPDAIYITRSVLRRCQAKFLTYEIIDLLHLRMRKVIFQLGDAFPKWWLFLTFS